MTATDRDVDVNDLFDYNVVQASPYGDFIQANNGSVYLTTCCLDFEDNQEFVLTLEVGPDNMTVSDSANLTIYIFDENDNAPFLSPSSLMVSVEELITSADIIVTVTAVDIDSGDNSRLNYTLWGNGSDVFEFRTGGALKLIPGQSLDYETTPLYNLYFQVHDNGVPPRSSLVGTLTINVIDQDDVPPMFTQTTYVANVDEDLAEGGTVRDITLTDRDTDPMDIVFEIMVTNPEVPDDQFEVGARRILSTPQGHLVYATVQRREGSPPLNRDPPNGQSMISVIIRARDNSGLTPASTSVLINILDINDSPPQIRPGDQTISFNEGETSVSIAGYTIEDADGALTSPIEYIIVQLLPSTNDPEFPLEGGYSDHANFALIADEKVAQLVNLTEAFYPLDEFVGPEGIIRPSPYHISGPILQPGEEANFTFFTWFLPGSEERHQVLAFTSAGYSVSIDLSSTQLFLIVNRTQVHTFDFPFLLNPIRWAVLVVKCIISGGGLKYYHVHVFSNEYSASFRVSLSAADSFTSSVHIFVGSQVYQNLYAQAVLVYRLLSNEEIRQLITAGEYIYLPGSVENVYTIENPFRRSLEIYFNGSNSSASQAIMENALNSLVYHVELPEPQPQTRQISLQAKDSVNFGPTSSLQVSANLVDDLPPSVDLNGLNEDGVNFATQYEESSTGSLIVSPEAIIYDQDSGISLISQVQLRVINVGGTAGTINDILETTDNFPAELLFDFQNNGVAFLVPADLSVPNLPASTFTAGITSILYRYNAAFQRPLARSLEVTAMDASGKVNAPVSAVAISLTLVNDPPVLLNFEAVASFHEEIGSITVLQGTSQIIQDVDSNGLSAAYVSLLGRPDGALEYLTLDLSGNAGFTMTSESTASTYTLRITGSGTFDTYVSILRNVMYINDNRNPGKPDLTDRVVSFIVVDNGDAFGGDSVESDPALVNITITPFLDLVVVYMGGFDVRNYTNEWIEDTGCIPITVPDVVVDDIEGDGQSAVPDVVLQITSIDGDATVVNTTQILYTNNNTMLPVEYLYFAIPRGTGLQSPPAVDTAAGTVTYGVNGLTANDLRVVLQNTHYCNLVNEPNNASRIISVTVSDPSSPNRVPRVSYTTVNIDRQNDVPEIRVSAQDSIAVRSRPTQVYTTESIDLLDPDDSRFGRLEIYILNPQNAEEDETIVFDANLPTGAVSRGPLPTSDYPDAFFFEVTFGEGGATQQQIIDTISQIRYQNNATNVRENVVRQICLTVTDFEVSSSLTCVDIELSAANLFKPSFVNASVPLANITVEENQDRIAIDQQIATDDDTDNIAATVRYSISTVSSITPNGMLVTSDEVRALFSVDAVSGIIYANSLDAEQYVFHSIDITATDQGNPQLSSSLSISVVVQDVNDNAPVIMVDLARGGIFVDDNAAGITLAILSISDPDVSNNNIDTNSLEFVGGNSRFGFTNIDPQSDGSVTVTITNLVVLDRETLGDSVQLLVSVQDVQGRIGSATVAFTITDVADNPPTVEQRTDAIFATERTPRSPISIGPAIYVNDPDENPLVESCEVMLTPNQDDQGLSLSDCSCQNAIFENCLVPNTETPIDILRVAQFSGSVVERFDQTERCDEVELFRDDPSQETDGLGIVPRSMFPPDAFNGNGFTFTMVLQQFSEGFPLVFNNHESRFHLALWIRRRRLNIDYAYIDSTGEVVFDLSHQLTTNENFDKPITAEHHWALVVDMSDESNRRILVYRDCVLFETVVMQGRLADIPADAPLHIGKPVPKTLTNGRFAGNISGYFYHSRPLSASEIGCLCACGGERLIPPSTLPEGTSVDSSQGSTTLVFNSDPPLPANNYTNILRQVQYENTILNPTLGDRDLSFRCTDSTATAGSPPTGTSEGSIHLVSDDSANPVIDLNGIGAGRNYETTFQEGGSAVAVTDVAVQISRMSITNPSIQTLTVSIVNPSETDDERLTFSVESNQFVTVTGSNTDSITVTGPGIASDFISAARSIRYGLLSTNPNTADRQLNFTVTDTEGRSNTELANTVVHIIPLNDAPTVSVNSAFSNYTEGHSSVLIAPELSISDPDNTEMIGATVYITGNLQTGDSLGYSEALADSLGIDVSFDPAALAFMGAASVSDYEQLLQTVTFVSLYSPLLDDPYSVEANAREVSFIVTDVGNLHSNVDITHVYFYPINDPPSIAINGSTDVVTVFVEGGTPVRIAHSVVITDPDNSEVTRTVLDLRNPQGTLEALMLPAGSFGPRLVLAADAASNIENIVSNTVYSNLHDEPSLVDRTITISVLDNAVNMATLTITLSIIPQNDNDPAFSDSLYMFSVNENSELGESVGLVSATDVDSITGLPSFQYRVVDASQPFEFFYIEASNSAELRVSGSLDFEMQDTYNFLVEVVDEMDVTTARTGTATVRVSITDVPEAPFLDLSAHEDSTANQIGFTRFAEGSDRIPLFSESIDITDSDFFDGISRLVVTLSDVQNVERESLTVDGQLSGDIGPISFDVDEFTLTVEGVDSTAAYIDLLRNITYLNTASNIGQRLVRVTSVQVTDSSGELSNVANASVLIANAPVFDQSMYTVDLTENVLYNTITIVTATTGLDIPLVYRIENQYSSLVLINGSGFVYLSGPLNHEDVGSVISFEVYAVDEEEPPVTGTTTITINVENLNDEPPEVSYNETFELQLPGPTFIFENGFSLVDPDGLPLSEVIVSVTGAIPLSISPFSGNNCWEDYDVHTKLTQACGVTNTLKYLTPTVTLKGDNSNRLAVTSGGAMNDKLVLGANSYAEQDNLTDCAYFEGTLQPFAFITWIKLEPDSSGYIVSFSNRQGTERYFSVEYDSQNSRILVYLKRKNGSGFAGLVRVVFQLSERLDDGTYHFVMITYSNRDVKLAVDANMVTSHVITYPTQVNGNACE